jgi:hypothetical protein
MNSEPIEVFQYTTGSGEHLCVAFMSVGGPQPHHRDEITFSAVISGSPLQKNAGNGVQFRGLHTGYLPIYLSTHKKTLHVKTLCMDTIPLPTG